MAISAAKLEASRRNAQKSTGPRTEAGKDRSKMNAVSHGCRAETLVLPEEDPQELEDRRATWTASLVPRCELEQRAVDDAVICSWRQDRARRAEAKRAHARLEELSDEEPKATAEQEAVLELGRRLFTDRMGPLRFYPATVNEGLRSILPREVSTSFPRKDDNEPDIPEVLVLRLQSTLKGCEWLLGEWTKLKATLDAGKPWIITDKLRAVRLLGRQPFDVLDDEDVALIYLASHRLEPAHADWAWEILTEMNEKGKTQFRSDVASRGLEALKPATATEARSALLAVVARQTERLTAKAETHRERERAKAARLADLLSFDDSIEGERLRRFEITSGRGYNRAIDTFLKLRRAEAIGQVSIGPSPDVSAPLSGDPWPVANVANEANDRAASVVSCPLSAGAPLREDVTVEAIALRENLTNEPTDFSSLIVVNRFREGGFADSPVAGAGTNEATVGQLSVVGCPLSGDRCEPLQDVTNEAGRSDFDQETVPQPVGTDKAPASHEDAVERIRRTREEHVRKLNEQARKEAEQAMASRRARLDEQRKSGEKPKNRLTGQARRGTACGKPEAAGLNADRLSNLVEASLGQHENAHRNA
jgi:hypothetical protein